MRRLLRVAAPRVSTLHVPLQLLDCTACAACTAAWQAGPGMPLLPARCACMLTHLTWLLLATQVLRHDAAGGGGAAQLVLPQLPAEAGCIIYQQRQRGGAASPAPGQHRLAAGFCGTECGRIAAATSSIGPSSSSGSGNRGRARRWRSSGRLRADLEPGAAATVWDEWRCAASAGAGIGCAVGGPACPAGAAAAATAGAAAPAAAAGAAAVWLIAGRVDVVRAWLPRSVPAAMHVLACPPARLPSASCHQTLPQHCMLAPCTSFISCLVAVN